MKKMNPKDIAGLTAKIAQDNSMVNKQVDEMLNQVDRLVDASLADDLVSVRSISDSMARSGYARGFPEVAEAAMKLCATIDNEKHEDIKRQVVHLIGRVGNEKQKMPSEMKAAIKNTISEK